MPSFGRVFVGLWVLALVGSPAQADTLEDVMAAGTLRCAVVLDFPPMGFRDDDGKPQGFDVEYCKDLAASLDVAHEILPVTWDERLPAITGGKADVVFGGTSDTLQRARTVGFSIPYAVFHAQAVVDADSGIDEFLDMKGKRIGAAATTLQEQEFSKYAARWGTEDLYRGYASEEALFDALEKGEIDAGIVTGTEVAPLLKANDNLKAGPQMPWTPDYTSVAAPRKDIPWLNYLNLFVTHQVRSGRYDELWGQFVGTPAPELKIPSVYY